MKRNNTTLRVLGAFGVCSLALTGCLMPSANDGMPLAQMTFDHIKPYPVYIASYEAVPFSGHVSLPQGFVTDPARLVGDYFAHRFEASGHQGKMRSVIESASVKHTVEGSDNNVGNFLGLGKKDHYRIDVVVNLQAFGVGANEIKEVRLKAHRDIYISEHVSLVEREKAQMEGMDSLIDDLDTAVRNVLSNEFSVLGQK